MKKYWMKVWTAFMWLGIWTDDKPVWIFRFCEKLEILSHLSVHWCLKMDCMLWNYTAA